MVVNVPRIFLLWLMGMNIFMMVSCPRLYDTKL
jgi:hypothetical protein